MNNFAVVIYVLSRCWTAIQDLHSGLPNIKIVPGAGKKMDLQWQVYEISGVEYHELIVSRGYLEGTAEEILAKLLHEAAHVKNHVRGVIDVSLTSQYHNNRFKLAAEEMGLCVIQIDHYGYRETTLSEAAALLYSNELALLRKNTVMEPLELKPKPVQRNRLHKAVCACSRIIRLSQTAFQKGGIRCEICGKMFKWNDEV